MLQKYSRYKILQEFFDFPMKNFQIREISRRTKIAQTSVTNHLKILKKEKLILKEKNSTYPTFRANRDNELFRLHKKMNLFFRIQQSNLLDYIYDSCVPDVIIMFGSAAKGEDIETSDVDIFVKCSSKKLNLEKYNNILNRRVSLFFEEDFSRLSKELKNNILNGIILKGYLKVF